MQQVTNTEPRGLDTSTRNHKHTNDQDEVKEKKKKEGISPALLTSAFSLIHLESVI